MVEKIASVPCLCKTLFLLSNEKELANHIGTCKTYKQASPAFKAFISLNLSKFSLPDLIALKCEYQNYINACSAEFKKSSIFLFLIL